MADLLLEKEPPPPKPDPQDEEEDDGARMSFLDHLDELRRRLLHSILYVVIVVPACWYFREEIYHWVAKPIMPVVPAGKLVITSPTEGLSIYLKLSVVAGIFLASPLVLYQVWLFISPGLYRKEKRFVLPFLFSSTLLFLAGGVFAYYVALPQSLAFLMEFSKAFTHMITASQYFDFAAIIILGMGAVFQIPVLVAFLSMFGIITPKFMLRNLRYAVLIIFIIAAVISPGTDLMSQIVFAAPMLILYVVSIGVSWIFKRRRDRLEQ